MGNLERFVLISICGNNALHDIERCRDYEEGQLVIVVHELPPMRSMDFTGGYITHINSNSIKLDGVNSILLSNIKNIHNVY